MNNRRLAVAALVLASTGMVACSSSAKQSIGAGSTTVAEIPSTSVVTTDSAPVSTAPPVSAPPVSSAPDTTLPKHNLWDKVDPPKVPTGHTDPFLSSGVLADGKYWVNYNGGEKQTPDITVIQVFFGKECEEQAAAHGDECLNDVYSLDKPSRDISDLPFHDNVFLTVADSASQLSYWITPAELVKIRASSPSAGAPSGFGFVSFSFLMTVKKGQITRFEQVWTP